MAVASFILAITSFFGLGMLGSVPAVVLGHIVMGQIRRGELSERSRGMAVAGLVLGYINLVLMAAVFAVVLVFLLLGFGLMFAFPS
jgi:hypothetical protein